MRSLNSSLPSSNSNRSAPPQELLQAFRTAALSVTNLYKSAATNQASARQEGYQDALEDLLKFLDKENLGLQDGEGWRVRQWATARYEGGMPQQEEEQEEEEHEERESDPTSRAISQDREEATINIQEDQPRIDSRQDPEDDSNSDDRQPLFRFTANTPQENNMQTDEPSSPLILNEPSSSSTTSPIRVEVLNRNNRPNTRNQNGRHTTRTNQRDFTFTAGTKRKLQFPDFFDISSLGEKRDGSGDSSGQKRGRFA